MAMDEKERILVVEDEVSVATMVAMMLRRENYEVAVASSYAEFIDIFEDQILVVTDLRLGDATGIDVLKKVRELRTDTQILLMTAFASTQTAVEAMRLGAYDYVEKPFKRDEFLLLVGKAVEKALLLRDNAILRKSLADGDSGIIGKSAKMREIFELVHRVAPSKTSVLIQGESGTGKELVARMLHKASGRKGAFIPVNCGAIPESLMESELFGYVKGAFTGAQKDKEGYFSLADKGTLFLDEVAELTLAAQVKLLRALQEKKVVAVGSGVEKEVDIRVVAATHKDLEKEMSEGRFREDLYYRLHVICIHVPPLRERLDDIPILARHFVSKFATEQGKRIYGLTRDALDALTAHKFPGNIRELENMMEASVTLCGGEEITLSLLPPNLVGVEKFKKVTETLEIGEGIEMEALVERLEKRLILQALSRADGNKTEAAKLLGLTFRALRYRMKKYALGDADA